MILKTLKIFQYVKIKNNENHKPKNKVFSLKIIKISMKTIHKFKIKKTIVSK